MKPYDFLDNQENSDEANFWKCIQNQTHFNVFKESQYAMTAQRVKEI